MGAIILVVTIVVLFGGALFANHTHNKNIGARKPVEAIEKKDSTGLSPVSKAVYNEYMSLPVDSRPFDDISSILKSLDATMRHLPGFHNHFNDNYHMKVEGYGSGFENHKFSWNAASLPRQNSRYLAICDHKYCDYSTYYNMHLEILRVKNALDKKQIALVRSENAHNVSMADELVEALRLEAGIQKQTTLEIEGKH